MRSSPLARPLTAVAAAVLVTGVLAGCTGSVFGSGCTPEFAPGDATSAVTVSGEVGRTPVVDLPTPLIAEEPQRSVAIEGEGAEIEAGSIARVDYVSYDGQTGSVLNEETRFLTAGEVGLALGESLVCAHAGSRLVVVGPAEELDATYAGATATLVAVLDVDEVFLGKANGVNQLPLDGMPTVVTAVDGTPGLALGYQADVTEPRVATIKAGSGATVEEGETVVFHARSFTWSSASATEASLGGIDSWTTGNPYPIAPTVDSMGDETLVDAIVGAKVGSQVLVVLPDETGGATAYVFDILGILAE